MVVFFLSFSRFSPSSSSFSSLSSVSFFPPIPAPFSFPLNSFLAFTHNLNSLSHAQEVFFAGFGLNFCWEEGGKERHAAAAGKLWEEEGSPSLSLCIYTSYKLRWGVWGWVRGVLVRVLVCLKLVLPLPLGSLRQLDCFPNFQLG